MDRLAADPNLHVYHLAPYEPTAVKRLAGRYGTREEEAASSSTCTAPSVRALGPPSKATQSRGSNRSTPSTGRLICETQAPALWSSKHGSNSGRKRNVKIYSGHSQ